MSVVKRTFSVLLFICVNSSHMSTMNAPNVGTVLFVTSDVNRTDWTKAGICLLEARMHFQNFLPEPQHLSMMDEDYVHSLLEYFKKTYKNVNNMAKDRDDDVVMTFALSDVIGGFLKLWALPVAKFSFYGGTLSQESTLKLYRFYDTIKDYLDSSGEGWQCPNNEVLRSVLINIAPLPQLLLYEYTQDPCSGLIYYENEHNLINIPLPQINWDAPNASMFIPLHNESLVSLNTPTNTLMKYYYSAKNCLRSRNVSNQDEFDNNLQYWLASDVLPHLKDDNLYLAFHGVLSLVNKSKDICNKVIEGYGPNFMTNYSQSYLTHMGSCFTINKIVIVLSIFLLEVIWCIGALMYMMCRKVRKRNNSTYNGSKRKGRNQSVNILNNIFFKSWKTHCKYASNSETQTSSTECESDSNKSINTQTSTRVPKDSNTKFKNIHKYPAKYSAQCSSVTSTKINKHTVPPRGSFSETRANIQKTDKQNHNNVNRKKQKSHISPVPKLIDSASSKDFSRVLNYHSAYSIINETPRVIEISNSVSDTKTLSYDTSFFMSSEEFRKAPIPQRLNFFKVNTRNQMTVESKSKTPPHKSEFVCECEKCPNLTTEVNPTKSEKDKKSRMKSPHKHDDSKDKPQNQEELNMPKKQQKRNKFSDANKKEYKFICRPCLELGIDCQHTKSADEIKKYNQEKTHNYKSVDLKRNNSFQDTKKENKITKKQSANHRRRSIAKEDSPKSEEYPKMKAVMLKRVNSEQHSSIDKKMSANILYHNKETETHLEKSTNVITPNSKLEESTANIEVDHIKTNNISRSSRIPKLIRAAFYYRPIRASSPIAHKSFIPQPIKQAKDDISLKNAKQLDEKLNVTL